VGFDPGSIPTYPPVIHQNSSPKEFQAWNVWWICDGQVLHLLISWLSPNTCSQLPGTGTSQGTDFNSAAVMCDELVTLHCVPLASAGHLFDHADSLRHFVKHLPYGSTFDIIWESVLFSLSAAQTANQLPTFKSVVERVMNVDLNQTYFQPTCLHHLNSDTTSSTQSGTSKDNTSGASTPSAAPASQPCPPCSDYCKPGGSQEGISTDQNKPLAYAYLVDADVDLMTDGGAVNSDQHSSSTGVVDEDSPTSFTALGTMLHVPPTSAPSVNNDIFFDLY